MLLEIRFTKAADERVVTTLAAMQDALHAFSATQLTLLNRLTHLEETMDTSLTALTAEVARNTEVD